DWFCREFDTIYSGIRIEKKINIQENEVSGPLKTAIYRVLQEALNNVAKHSKANLANISLRSIDSTIELVVEDNGMGFDLKEALSVKSSRKGLGLSSMKERTELSGGSFAIESVKGSGTIVRAIWRQ
ncbi:MAG: two-component sensor histidine kinase, partial [Proteobacteria bacterium]|nr:two-component sensor histidine kinase [Pseudomonadota bacterium]